MKKHAHVKDAPDRLQDEPNLVGLINSLQQQLGAVERKIDSLISRSQPKPPEIKTFPNNLQFTPRPQNIPNPQQENRSRERTLHKAVCADCKKGCEVPFKPSGDRPVYCKDCFSKRKSANSFNARPNNRPIESKFVNTPPAEKKPPSENKKSVVKKSAGKKKPSPKKRKAKG